MKRAVIGSLGVLASPVLLAMQRARDAGVVLLYHRVSDQRDPAYDPLPIKVFRRHCEILAEHYQVLPLWEFVDRVRAGDSVRGCCAITFDDGYRDFLDNAYPLLEAFGLPATHFLVSDCVRTGKPTWNLRLRHVARRQASDATAVAALEARHAAALNAMSPAERYAWLDAAEAEVGAEGPKMLDAADLKRVDADLIEWASHTASHPTLAALDAQAVREEFARSRVELEAMAERPVRFISYPSGSYSAETTSLAREAGYAAAFAVDQRETPNDGADLFALPRMDVGTLPPNMLLAETTGAVEALRRRLRGRTAA